MKLAELLILRKAEKNNLAFLEGRLKANAKVQEGEKPQENPGEILQKIRESLVAIENYTTKINRVNHATAWAGEGHTTLAGVLTYRDLLSKHRRVLTAALDAITVKEPRYGRLEIKYVPMLEASTLITQINDVSKRYADLENRIQKTNWNTEV